MPKGQSVHDGQSKVPQSKINGQSTIRMFGKWQTPPPVSPISPLPLFAPSHLPSVHSPKTLSLCQSLRLHECNIHSLCSLPRPSPPPSSLPPSLQWCRREGSRRGGAAQAGVSEGRGAWRRAGGRDGAWQDGGGAGALLAPACPAARALLAPAGPAGRHPYRHAAPHPSAVACRGNPGTPSLALVI